MDFLYDHDKISRNQVAFLVYSSHFEELVDEKYLVYDLTSMIGTLGGSLGLLIGFSFFDVICTVFDHLQYLRERFLAEI